MEMDLQGSASFQKKNQTAVILRPVGDQPVKRLHDQEHVTAGSSIHCNVDRVIGWTPSFRLSERCDFCWVQTYP